MHLKALIFDLDGTILANEIQFEMAFCHVLSNLGIKSENKKCHLGGIGVEENWIIYSRRFGIDKNNINKYSEQTLDKYYELLPKVKIKPGFVELVDLAKKHGMKIALATSSLDSIVTKVFDHFPIRNLFDVIVTGDEVKNKKPDPAIFNLALQRLDVENIQSVIFEDSVAGVEAAKLAKIKTVAIFKNEKHKNELSDADAFFGDFKPITIDFLNSLVMGIN